MASAAASQLFGGSPAQIEYAAEMGLEHHLGMTCDPVCGLVQIPCIERNAYAAARALDANIYSAFTDGNHRVSFDKVVEVMKQTGHDLLFTKKPAKAVWQKTINRWNNTNNGRIIYPPIISIIPVLLPTSLHHLALSIPPTQYILLSG